MDDGKIAAVAATDRRGLTTDTIIPRLLAAVEASGISQSEISRRAGQRPTWLGDLLQAWRGRGRRGAEPTVTTLRLLARGLGVGLGELLGEDVLWRAKEET